MRSEKGITLTSLVVYIIVLTIVIGTVAMITRYFTSNTSDVVISSNTTEQYTRFTEYLTDDLNSINCSTVKADDTTIIIAFLDDTCHKYSYIEEDIYYYEYPASSPYDYTKIIKLCSNIEDFSAEKDETNEKLKISVTINGITYNNNYSL